LSGAANGCTSTAAAAARLCTSGMRSSSFQLLRLLLLQWWQQSCLLTAGRANSHTLFWLDLRKSLLCIVMLLDGEVPA
jgi:hypothetical protein